MQFSHSAVATDMVDTSIHAALDFRSNQNALAAIYTLP